MRMDLMIFLSISSNFYVFLCCIWVLYWKLFYILNSLSSSNYAFLRIFQTLPFRKWKKDSVKSYDRKYCLMIYCEIKISLNDWQIKLISLSEQDLAPNSCWVKSRNENKSDKNRYHWYYTYIYIIFRFGFEYR